MMDGRGDRRKYNMEEATEGKKEKRNKGKGGQ
jgi:hypothetical protein